MARWGFLTNHAHVLIQIARRPRSTVREVALATGITERASITILQSLRQAGIVSTEREGRRNVNRILLSSLEKHRPWSGSSMEIPQPLIDATLRGLSHIAVDDSCLRDGDEGPSLDGARWGFLTTHALCLIYVTQHDHSTVREIAQAVGVTERATHAALRDLREAGIIEQERQGRRNSYSVNFDHLAAYRREGTAPDLVPDPFVSSLVEALLALRPAV